MVLICAESVTLSRNIAFKIGNSHFKQVVFVFTHSAYQRLREDSSHLISFKNSMLSHYMVYVCSEYCVCAV